MTLKEKNTAHTMQKVRNDMTNSEAVSLLMSNEYYNRGYKLGVSDVSDKIKRDIFNACSDSYHTPVRKLDCETIFEIIDKYRAGSEAE